MDEDDRELLDDVRTFIEEQRRDMRSAQRRIVGRWRVLRRKGEVIEDADRAGRLVRSFGRRVTACDRLLKKIQDVLLPSSW